jgi:hypothetical protein
VAAAGEEAEGGGVDCAAWVFRQFRFEHQTHRRDLRHRVRGVHDARGVRDGRGELDGADKRRGRAHVDALLHELLLRNVEDVNVVLGHAGGGAVVDEARGADDKLVVDGLLPSATA